MNTPLNTFPTPLLRLILCGSKGLALAWGPLDGSAIGGSAAVSAWHPWREVAITDRRVEYALLDEEDGDLTGWALPLDADSPWPARLALVAAWMASAWMPAGVSAEVIPGECWLHLYTYSGGVADIRAWACNDGGNIEPGAVQLDSPTLPQHLQTHPPTVALILALYDVPEIRARVEQT